MNIPLCPDCTQPLVRHISLKGIYWVCRKCYQEVKNISNLIFNLQPTNRKHLEKPACMNDTLYPCMKANQELQRLALLHRQTQIANRRRFEAYLDQEWDSMARQQVPLSLILGDLDFFKAYNDTYGHQAGDQCLQRIAEAAIAVVKRSADIVPRYGGEEFVVILPHTDADEAMQVAEDIRSEVKALEINHPNSQQSPYLSLSLGVASMIPTAEGSSAMLIAAADQALYQAKAQGRDRVILHEILLQKTQTVQQQTISALPESNDDSENSNGEATKPELLMSYVAYYVSRGKSIISPQSGLLSFQKSVYQYWGYHRDFQEFWSKLSSRQDFRDLYLQGDLYCFGQFLDGNCTVGECSRCTLPIPMGAGHVYDKSNCTLCIDSWLSDKKCDHSGQEVDNQLEMNRVVAVGATATDCKNQQEWFAINGFEVTFVSKSEDLTLEFLPSNVNLVLIYDSMSEAEGNVWAHKLRHYPQLRGVPIVALSTEAGQGLPWMNRKLEIADYVLAPYTGDRLANHLRQVLQLQSSPDLATLHWFPR